MRRIRQKGVVSETETTEKEDTLKTCQESDRSEGQSCVYDETVLTKRTERVRLFQGLFMKKDIVK